MKVDLQARYQTIDEVIADLEAYESRRLPNFRPPVSEELTFDENSTSAPVLFWPAPLPPAVPMIETPPLPVDVTVALDSNTTP